MFFYEEKWLANLQKIFFPDQWLSRGYWLTVLLISGMSTFVFGTELESAINCFHAAASQSARGMPTRADVGPESQFLFSFRTVHTSAAAAKAGVDELRKDRDATWGDERKLYKPRLQAKKSIQLSPKLRALRSKVRRVLGKYSQRRLNTRDHGPWAIMHAVIAHGVRSQVYQGHSKGDPITAIGLLCFNQPAGGQRLFIASDEKFTIAKGPGVQGHHGQFLAVLAQSRVMEDYPIKVVGKDFTVSDLVEYEKVTCHPSTELTFKLIGLMHYLDSDVPWENESGQKWSIQRMIREELAQPIRGAPCGGTHRLMGLSYAVQKRMKRGKPVVGEFRRAQVFIRDYHKYAFSLQNLDGSFSTKWFRGREALDDSDRRLRTTGHVLEWLVFSLPQSKLTHSQTVKAVHYLTNLLARGDIDQWEIGPLGHALRALVLYDRHVFNG